MANIDELRKTMLRIWEFQNRKMIHLRNNLFLEKFAKMAETERTGPEPKKCDWQPKDVKTGVRGEKCGSDKGIRTIERDYGWGGRTNENICEKHVLDAWKKFRSPSMPVSDIPDRK